MKDLPTIQHISSDSISDIHALDSLEYSFNINNQKKHNGFFMLSDDGKIYQVKFKSLLSNDNMDEQQNIAVCFPPYVNSLF